MLKIKNHHQRGFVLIIKLLVLRLLWVLPSWINTACQAFTIAQNLYSQGQELKAKKDGVGGTESPSDMWTKWGRQGTGMGPPSEASHIHWQSSGGRRNHPFLLYLPPQKDVPRALGRRHLVYSCFSWFPWQPRSILKLQEWGAGMGWHMEVRCVTSTPLFSSLSASEFIYTPHSLATAHF